MWNGFVAYPKDILAYLKAGCGIKQLGMDQRYQSTPSSAFLLFAPMEKWEVRVNPDHVRAMEKLDLLEIDSAAGNTWYLKGSFSIPCVFSGQEERTCKVLFSDTQKQAMGLTIEKWEGIAAEAAALAADCPSRDLRRAMERKAAHYRACTHDLLELLRE